jgi:hypothetical protein
MIDRVTVGWSREPLKQVVQDTLIEHDPSLDKHSQDLPKIRD